MGVDPQRFRQNLIRGLTEDGLEELTLRIVRKDYANAHRTGRGRDGGIDVLSDYQRPPTRAWQSKTSTKDKADWTKCRKSLQSAMTSDAPSRHYTFVFNHPLSSDQRDFWRDTFAPEIKNQYPDLTVDYWDDLAWKIENYPEIIDWLTDGALATYVRTTLGQAAETGVNPLANAVDLTEGLHAVAQHAEHVGRGDPRFAYGETGREADASDSRLRERRARITMSTGQQSALPMFNVTIRKDNQVREVTARPREGAQVRAPEPWFADNPDGLYARALARARLARGLSVSFTGPHVGISGGDIPDRFTSWFDTTQGSDSGHLELGVSEPLTLTLTLTLPHTGEVTQTVPLHRVPAEPMATLAYAGVVGAAVLAIDVTPAPNDATNHQDNWMECALSITLDIHGVPVREALRGLGFSRAFGAAKHLHFECPGLLPASGYDIDGQLTMGSAEAEVWEVAALIALTLDGLQFHDGVARHMPETVTERDVSRATLISHLLQDGQVAVPVPRCTQFAAPLPLHAALDDDPQTWQIFTEELPPFVGQPTGLVVEQMIELGRPVRIEQNERGSLSLICESGPQGASIVMRTADQP
jgi:hypothetical protein